MAGLKGLFVQRDAANNGTSPKGARLALGGLLGRSSTGTVQTGVLVDSMANVVTGTGSMTYSVRSCAIVTKASDANGPVVSVNDAAYVVATTAAPGSNSRIDSIYAVQDLITADGGSGTTNEFRVEVVQGTVSATPAPPGIPSGGVRLANVRVTSGATATSGLTFDRTVCEWTTANGGTAPVDRGGRTFRLWNGISNLLLRVGVDVSGLSSDDKAASYFKTGHYVSGVDGAANTNASGDISITFPEAYPVALTNVQLTNTTGAGPLTFTCTFGTSDRTKITARVTNPAGGAHASQPISVMWLAVGN